MVAAIDDFTGAFADFRTEIEELIDDEEHVIAVVDQLLDLARKIRERARELVDRGDPGVGR